MDSISAIVSIHFPRSSDDLSCSRSSSSPTRQTHGRSATAFSILVTFNQMDEISGSWTVIRTYHDFSTLYYKLKKHQKDVVIPQYPFTSNHLFRPYDEKNASKAQIFLDSLCEIPEILDSQHICAFLIGSFLDISQNVIFPANVAAQEAKSLAQHYKSILKEKNDEIRQLQKELLFIKGLSASSDDSLQDTLDLQKSEDSCVGSVYEELSRTLVVATSQIKDVNEECKRLSHQNEELNNKVLVLTEEVTL